MLAGTAGRAFRPSSPTEDAMRTVHRAPLTALVLVLLAAGPSAADEKKPTGEVTGRIAFRGQPLPTGTVALHPAQGKPITAQVQPDGTFRLEKVPVGEMAVTVEATKDGRPLMPAQYADPKKSGLKFEVKQGRQECNIDLK
jgi:hypothetical protein